MVISQHQTSGDLGTSTDCAFIGSNRWLPRIGTLGTRVSTQRGALKFVNRVGELAEEQGHYPDIFLAWGKIESTTWTHKINSLMKSDFTLAVKFNQIQKS